jgi:hypothetical protein
MWTKKDNMREQVYQLAVYTLWCAVGAAVCWWSNTWALLFDNAWCCGVWMAGSRQGLRVLWVCRAVVRMTYPESTVHCHVTGIDIGESWLGGQGMQNVQNVFLSPLSPYSHPALSRMPVLMINRKQKWWWWHHWCDAHLSNKEILNSYLIDWGHLLWNFTHALFLIILLRLGKPKLKHPSCVIVHLSAALLPERDICRRTWVTLISSSHASVLERNGYQWMKWFKIIFLLHTAAVF